MNYFKLGLCSVTFRKKTAEEVVALSEKAGISFIEWGGDVHVKTLDDAKKVKALCDKADIKISSYGSYFNSAKYDECKWTDTCKIAKEMGVSLTDDEKKAADDNMQSLKDDCESDEDYQKGLESAYLSEYVAYSLGYNELLYSAVYQTAAHTGKYFKVDGDTVLQFARENFLFCRQFVIKTDDPIGDTQAQVKAEAIHARLKAGEDAAAILKDYESDDKVVGAYYCFAKTEDFLALDEEAVALMEPGQISDIRMDGEGFHIIIRLAPDEEYLDENLTEGVFESYCMHQLVLMQNEIKNAYEVRYINKKTPESYR